MRSRIVANLVIAGIVLLGMTSGCSRTPAPPGGASGTTPPSAPNATPQEGQVVSQIGLGQFSGHTYTNDQFKLAVTIPEEWYVQKKSETDQLMQATNTVVKQNANTQSAVKEAQQRGSILVSAFRHPPGPTFPSNASLTIVAENASFLPRQNQGHDYLKETQRSLADMKLKNDVEPVETGFKIGSHPAARLRVHLHVLDKLIEQEYYAARVGDYFLVVILSYTDDEQREAVRSILELLKTD